MNTDNIYCSFQHYDKKGRRLSIFGRPFSDGSGMDILVFTCSKQDVFKKKTGWDLFMSFTGVYQFKEVVKMSPEHHVELFVKRHEFLQWCDEHFSKCYNVTAPVTLKILLNYEQRRQLEEEGAEAGAIAGEEGKSESA